MPDFGVNLGRREREIQKNIPKLNDLKLIFLELVHLGLCSGEVWDNRFWLQSKIVGPVPGKEESGFRFITSETISDSAECSAGLSVRFESSAA